MDTASERLGNERAWAGAVATAVVALVGGALVFPKWVYDGFIWHYFWGPVVADAKGAACAVREGGTTRFIDSASACASAPEPVAVPGYTLVSEVGYAVTLIVALLGVVLLLRRLNVGRDRGLFYALFPFMLFGGALRVVEDANDALRQTGAEAIPFPWNTLIISPIIYFTVFFVTLAGLVVSISLARRGVFEDYERPLAGIGTLVLAATMGYLGVLAFTTRRVGFYPQVLVVVLVGATLVTAVTWWGIDRYAPEINAGTGFIGAVVIWGHSVDGVANVVVLDWASALGLKGEYGAKHPVNAAIIDVTSTVLPESVAAAIGTVWPFLLVKIVAATAVVWVFDEQIFEESPRYAILLLIAILAVGLGPGTRDMLRATFGI
ncbi:hypothetical protein ZOD2009_09825 [Haladaptatus paucihalophilus DX253]|uniref:Uncharacterized membrane protein n=1 Tax=Haladaptatus paucihalophilus DX253 TaxID=797209 RepID=E7QSV7_HALPU|nr:DUF63 family protein [Haladaptatus paucihalophilus]EFW92346.1 hypothetical protein ZOD2009_09825 [Haladaptatus paucihalophilus DX253]SHL61049.1 Uncharacterized membrane protein [Haladaptatus paucihalophilus DX253]